MRAARIVCLVLLTLLLTKSLVAQVPSPMPLRTGLTMGAYTLRFDLKTKPPLPRMQWSQDREFATKAEAKSREFAAPFGSPWAVWRSRLPAEDSVCYTARSYLYARAGRRSDVTIPVGYRVCTPSARFQVRSADLPR
jgi:hypothetical protein